MGRVENARCARAQRKAACGGPACDQVSEGCLVGPGALAGAALDMLRLAATTAALGRRNVLRPAAIPGTGCPCSRSTECAPSNICGGSPDAQHPDWTLCGRSRACTGQAHGLASWKVPVRRADYCGC